MGRIPRRFCVLAVCLIVLNAGGLLWMRHELLRQSAPEQQPLRIVTALPADDVDRTERLSLVFNRAVGEPQTLNTQLEESPPFALSPLPQGQWRWTMPNRLDFILDAPLPAGKTFQIKPAGGAETQLGQVLQAGGEIEFQTRALELEDCKLMASDRRHVTFELTFNQPVAPEELLNALSLSDGSSGKDADRTATGNATTSPVANNGQRFNPISLVNEPAESLVIRCDRPDTNQLLVGIDGPLKGHGADRPLEKSVSRKLKIDPVFAYLRTQVRDMGIGEFFQVDVYFTASLGADQRLPDFPMSPSVAGVQARLVGNPRYGGRRLQLKGRFEPGQRYRLELPATLLAESGKTLGRTTPVTFDVPDRSPQVELAAHQGILSPFGNLEMELRTVNVGSVKFRASRLHANNLIPHLHGEWHRRTSVALAEKTFAFDRPQNVEMTHVVELGKLLDRPLGLYQLSADATDASWTGDSAVIAVTDLALTLKQQRNRLHVWVTSLRHGKPVADVRVSSMSYNNQTLATGTTNEYGLAELQIDPAHPDGRPWVIVAEHDKQIAWLQTDRDHWVIDDIDQSGRPVPETYDVLLYPERGTYRPGDMIHLTGIVRDAAGNVPAPFPLQLQVIRPDGRTVETMTVQPIADTQGVFHADWTTPQSAWTGAWRFEVRVPGDEKALAETHAYVEEFLPVRLEVQATPSQELFTDDHPTIDVTARYLFGTPGDGLAVRAVGEFRPATFVSSEYPGFTFGTIERGTRIDVGTLETQLDHTGRGELDFTGKLPEQPGRWQGAFSATVTEDGGRSVSSPVRFELDMIGRHLGVRLKSGTTVAVNSDFEFEWLLRTADDRSAAFAPVQFELLKVEFDNVLRRTGDNAVWETIERTTSVWKHAVTDAPTETSTDAPADGPTETPTEPSTEAPTESLTDAATGVPTDTSTDDIGSVTTLCPHPGVYRLVAVDSQTKQQTVLQFRAVTAESARLSTALNRPERLELTLDRSEYRPGETAQVVVTSPFAGQLWLSLETDRGMLSSVTRLEENSAVVSLLIPDDMRGGAFISATLVRAVDPNRTEWLPHRAYGLTHLVTEHADHRLPVTIAAPASAQPGETVGVTVTAQPGAMLHVWAVDEGILATSAYSTPDPHAHFFASRRRDVIASDVFSQLLPDHRRPDDLHKIGGDGEADDALRRNPVPSRRRESAVLWSTFQHADANGELSTTLTLPRMTGQLRLMAVGVAGDNYGAAETAMTVTTPLLVEATWPRFAAPLDTFRVPAKVFNTTSGPVRATVQCDVRGPLTVVHDESTVVIPAESSHIVWLTATATSFGPVEGGLRAEAVDDAGTNLVSESAFKFPIRPAGVLTTDREFVTLKTSEPHALTVSSRFLPEMVRSRVTVSAHAEQDLQPAVGQLLQYPYGCVEQTTSQLRGILAAKSWLGLQTAATADERREAVSTLVATGIARLWSMQTRGGGLSYWPGSSEPHLWGSVYAGEVLLDARESGFAVDSRFLSSLQEFLESSLQRANHGQSLDANEIAEIVGVLSRLDAPPIGWMSRLTERIEDLDMAGRAQLALAWFHAGRRDRTFEALPADTIDLSAKSSLSGRFMSGTTQHARLLRALLKIDSQHAWIPQLVERVQKARRDGRWLSTLENALVVDALSVHQAQAGLAEPVAGQVTLGKRVFDLQPGETRVLDWTPAEEANVLSIDGSGHVYATVETTGLTQEPPADRDHVIRVRRRWLDRQERTIDPQHVRVGDLIHVEVTLQAIGQSSVESIAVVDALPAGLEVENPRLRTSDASATDAGAAERVEFLDDRVVLFATATPRETTFRYALRAVTQGTFVVPPIQASCMYNESIESVTGGGRLTVEDVVTPPGAIAVDPQAEPLR